MEAEHTESSREKRTNKCPILLGQSLQRNNSSEVVGRCCSCRHPPHQRDRCTILRPLLFTFNSEDKMKEASTLTRIAALEKHCCAPQWLVFGALAAAPRGLTSSRCEKMSTQHPVQSKTAELARAVGEKLRTQGSAFLQRAWEWSLRHPEMTKYLLISGGFSTFNLLPEPIH